MLVAGLIVVFAVPWRRPVLSTLCIVAVALVVVAINMGFWFPRNRSSRWRPRCSCCWRC